MNKETADQIMSMLRELVEIDGGNVQLKEFTYSSISLELVLDGADCRECVMPSEFLSQIMLDQGVKIFPSLQNVVIIDPRVTDEH